MIAYTEASARDIPGANSLRLCWFAYAIYEGTRLIEQVVSAPFLGESTEGEHKAILCAHQYSPEVKEIWSDVAIGARENLAKKLNNPKVMCKGIVAILTNLGISFSQMGKIKDKLKGVPNGGEHYIRHNALHCLLADTGREYLTQWKQSIHKPKI